MDGEKDFDVEVDGHTFAIWQRATCEFKSVHRGYESQHELVVTMVDGEDNLYRDELF